MKVLLDECVPRKLRRERSRIRSADGHRERLVRPEEWRASRIGRGRIRCLPRSGLESDFQQNLQRFNIGIILMVARNNRFKTLLPLMPEVNGTIEEVKPGELARIGGS